MSTEVLGALIGNLNCCRHSTGVEWRLLSTSYGLIGKTMFQFNNVVGVCILWQLQAILFTLCVRKKNSVNPHACRGRHHILRKGRAGSRFKVLQAEHAHRFHKATHEIVPLCISIPWHYSYTNRLVHTLQTYAVKRTLKNTSVHLAKFSVLSSVGVV
jgi:hypothetical protein